MIERFADDLRPDYGRIFVTGRDVHIAVRAFHFEPEAAHVALLRRAGEAVRVTLGADAVRACFPSTSQVWCLTRAAGYYSLPASAASVALFVGDVASSILRREGHAPVFELPRGLRGRHTHCDWCAAKPSVPLEDWFNERPVEREFGAHPFPLRYAPCGNECTALRMVPVFSHASQSTVQR